MDIKHEKLSTENKQQKKKQKEATENWRKE